MINTKNTDATKKDKKDKKDMNSRLQIDVDLLEKYIFQENNEEEMETIQNEKRAENPKSISLYDFSFVNGLLISKKLKRIQFYRERYNLIENAEFIKIQNEKENTDIREKYVLYKNNTEMISFVSFLFHLPNIKVFLLYLMDSYSYLLYSLKILEREKICFFHLSTQNIVFSDNYNPILHEFQGSLLLEKCLSSDSYSYITEIINNRQNFTYTPLEVRLLFFIIKNKKYTVTKSEIEDISIHYTRSLSVLEFFSPREKEIYYNECVSFLTPYINKAKTDIIHEILNFIKTWDNFSTSLLYLHIVQHVICFFSPCQASEFIKDWCILLKENIHPNPLKRETLENTHIRFETLYEKYTDWSFIKECSSSNINELYDKILH